MIIDSLYKNIWEPLRDSIRDDYSSKLKDGERGDFTDVYIDCIRIKEYDGLISEWDIFLTTEMRALEGYFQFLDDVCTSEKKFDELDHHKSFALLIKFFLQNKIIYFDDDRFKSKSDSVAGRILENHPLPYSLVLVTERACFQSLIICIEAVNKSIYHQKLGKSLDMSNSYRLILPKTVLDDESRWVQKFLETLGYALETNTFNLYMMSNIIFLLENHTRILNDKYEFTDDDKKTLSAIIDK